MVVPVFDGAGEPVADRARHGGALWADPAGRFVIAGTDLVPDRLHPGPHPVAAQRAAGHPLQQLDRSATRTSPCSASAGFIALGGALAHPAAGGRPAALLQAAGQPAVRARAPRPDRLLPRADHRRADPGRGLAQRGDRLPRAAADRRLHGAARLARRLHHLGGRHRALQRDHDAAARGTVHPAAARGRNHHEDDARPARRRQPDGLLGVRLRHRHPAGHRHAREAVRRAGASGRRWRRRATNSTWTTAAATATRSSSAPSTGARAPSASPRPATTSAGSPPSSAPSAPVRTSPRRAASTRTTGTSPTSPIRASRARSRSCRTGPSWASTSCGPSPPTCKPPAG